MKARILALTLAPLCALPAAALAGGKTDRLAACMWSTMPTTTAAYVDASDRQAEFSLFLKAAAPCDMPGNIDFKSLKRTLAATRPATVAADSETGAQAFVCPRDKDGKVGACKPAGEKP
jgi:hypothetical protein